MITTAPSTACRMGASSKRQSGVGHRASGSGYENRPPISDPRLRVFAAYALAALAMTAGVAVSAQSLQDKIAQCEACHGKDGRSVDPSVPHIGGQPKLAVMYQLFFYREGRRKSEEMNLVAKELTDAELGAIADHVSKLPPPPPANGAVDEPRLKRGAELAASRMCASCHNPDFTGRQQMPRLAGQREAYTAKALQDYRTGARVGTQAAMAEAVRGLSDDDFGDLAY